MSEEKIALLGEVTFTERSDDYANGKLAFTYDGEDHSIGWCAINKKGWVIRLARHQLLTRVKDAEALVTTAIHRAEEADLEE